EGPALHPRPPGAGDLGRGPGLLLAGVRPAGRPAAAVLPADPGAGAGPGQARRVAADRRARPGAAAASDGGAVLPLEVEEWRSVPDLQAYAQEAEALQPDDAAGAPRGGGVAAGGAGAAGACRPGAAAESGRGRAGDQPAEGAAGGPPRVEGPAAASRGQLRAAAAELPGRAAVPGQRQGAAGVAAAQAAPAAGPAGVAHADRRAECLAP